MASDRQQLCGATRTGADLSHDLDPVTARIVDPFALSAIFTGHEVHLRSRWVLDGSSLDGDSVTGRVGRNYRTTDIASIHSLQPDVSHREVAGISRGPGHVARGVGSSRRSRVPFAWCDGVLSEQLAATQRSPSRARRGTSLRSSALRRPGRRSRGCLSQVDPRRLHEQLSSALRSP